MRAADDVVWCPVEGEIVLFHTTEGAYFGLSAVAARIWTLLNEGRTPDSVVETLVSEYEVDESPARSEVDRIVAELGGLKLLTED
ncbi:MAG TPA: PqqD family protein [Chthonomonadaceae bacterium]|nr:PqqD family protein [Chthonomonadaceae bacterium]